MDLWIAALKRQAMEHFIKNLSTGPLAKTGFYKIQLKRE
jgi:hypothetical protein